MKRKMSNKARVNISNAQHNRLASKNNDENIKHIRYVYDKFKRQIKCYNKELELYEWMIQRLENDGKTEEKI